MFLSMCLSLCMTSMTYDKKNDLVNNIYIVNNIFLIMFFIIRCKCGLCTCMCLCVHACVSACVFVFMCVCVSVNVFVCLFVCLCVCEFACVFMCVWTYVLVCAMCLPCKLYLPDMRLCVCVCVCVCVCACSCSGGSRGGSMGSMEPPFQGECSMFYNRLTS